MGQVFRRLHELERECVSQHNHTAKAFADNGFPDLRELPPELSLAVLSYLNATDLCLAACVWDTLGNDELLWQSLCKASWGEVSIYNRWLDQPQYSYKRLYLLLDEASLTFNGDPFVGMDYLISHDLVEDDPFEIAQFLHSTKRLHPDKRRDYLDRRCEPIVIRKVTQCFILGDSALNIVQCHEDRMHSNYLFYQYLCTHVVSKDLQNFGIDVVGLELGRNILEYLVQLQDFENLFLPTALRQFFSEISAPDERGTYLTEMMEKFSDRYCRCNPNLGLSKDTIFILCFSLIMLSVDLCSPHVKNKMSKREFIRNTRRAAQEVQDELAGHLYDNIYLVGHVAMPQKALIDHSQYRIVI